MTSDKQKSKSKCSLTICIVLYRPDYKELEDTIRSLKIAASRCSTQLKLLLINNSRADPKLRLLVEERFPDLNFQLISGHGNVGFGQANNMALEEIGTFHLILNPDVVVEKEALKNALRFMNKNPDCGLLTPLAHGIDGSRQFLCKRFPSVSDLVLRGFAPFWLQNCFKKRLDKYKMADLRENEVFWDPAIVSGCFMLFRGNVFERLHGFDPRFFLYFEDFDLSLRAREVTRSAFVPDVKIRHGGGNAGRKGIWHIYQFTKSAIQFYRKWGLKVW